MFGLDNQVSLYWIDRDGCFKLFFMEPKWILPDKLLCPRCQTPILWIDLPAMLIRYLDSTASEINHFKLKIHLFTFLPPSRFNPLQPFPIKQTKAKFIRGLVWWSNKDDESMFSIKRWLHSLLQKRWPCFWSPLFFYLPSFIPNGAKALQAVRIRQPIAQRVLTCVLFLHTWNLCETNVRWHAAFVQTLKLDPGPQWLFMTRGLLWESHFVVTLHLSKSKWRFF
jgi:hypothetical protein